MLGKNFDEAFAHGFLFGMAVGACLIGFIWWMWA
jgi:hypothetical protein